MNSIPEWVDDFRVLVEMAKPYPVSGQPLSPMHAIFGGANLTFEGAGYEQLQKLTDSLVDHALAAGGPSRPAVQRALVEACRTALDVGLEGGIAELAEFVDAPLSEWTVVEPIRGHYRVAPMRIGRCEVHTSLDTVSAIEPTSGMSLVLAGDLPPPILVTKVWARDEESALRRARDQFEETRAILMLFSDHIDLGRPASAVFDSEGNVSSMQGLREGFVLNQVSDDGTVPFSYQGLEASAATEPVDRSEWATRVLGAARWHRRARLSDWPSERIAASMNALECLFLGDGSSHASKGQQLADLISPRVTVRGMSKNESHAWIRDLYRRRNEVVHEGSAYLEDLDAERLVDLVTALVEWAAFHLHREHRHHDPPHVCTTRAEVLGP